MKVCELSKTVSVLELAPGDTFEYVGRAYMMTEMWFNAEEGIFDDNDKIGPDSLKVAVCLSSGSATFMYQDEEVTKLNLKVVFDREDN